MAHFQRLPIGSSRVNPASIASNHHPRSKVPPHVCKFFSIPRVHGIQELTLRMRGFPAAGSNVAHLGPCAMQARAASPNASPYVSRMKKVICGASSPRTSSYPELSTKPVWWWRTLACVPYLMPLHSAWSYAESIYHLQPVLESYSFLAYPFLETIMVMPSWLMLVLFMSTYFFVVRRKEWPHFLRFHVALAMLMDTCFQAAATACSWMPGAVFKGNLMRHFWLAVAFAQMCTATEGIRCALGGMYPNVPFLSDAASIHSDLKLLNF